MIKKKAFLYNFYLRIRCGDGEQRCLTHLCSQMCWERIPIPIWTCPSPAQLEPTEPSFLLQWALALCQPNHHLDPMGKNTGRRSMAPVSHHLVIQHNRRNSIGVKAAIQGSHHHPHHLFGATIALLFFPSPLSFWPSSIPRSARMGWRMRDASPVTSSAPSKFSDQKLRPREQSVLQPLNARSPFAHSTAGTSRALNSQLLSYQV